MIQVDETDPIAETVEPKFPYRDVIIKRGVDAKEHYDMITEIGRGKFGTVFHCKEKATGQEFAAKFIAVPKREDRRNVEREVEMMNALKHPKILQLYDAFEFGKMMCVVLELIEGGELFDRVLDENFLLTERACSIFMRQICEAMEYIHRNNIIHLDLKPENILCLTREGNRIKIIDFGLAREYDPDKKLQVLFGTPEFVAPEVVNFNAISHATDMWSIGVIAYVLISGLSPFAGETDIETMSNVTIGKYDFLDEAFDSVSPDAIDFITKLLMKEPNHRMTAAEAVKHRWVKRKPQYYPSNKPSQILGFKAIPLETTTTELGTTKENLKQFVERWGESTTSPSYIFNNENHIISPVRESIRANGISSSKGCSPTSCSSTPDLLKINDDDIITNNNLHTSLILDTENIDNNNNNHIANDDDHNDNENDAEASSVPSKKDSLIIENNDICGEIHVEQEPEIEPVIDIPTVREDAIENGGDNDDDGDDDKNKNKENEADNFDIPGFINFDEKIKEISEKLNELVEPVEMESETISHSEPIIPTTQSESEASKPEIPDIPSIPLTPIQSIEESDEVPVANSAPLPHDINEKLNEAQKNKIPMTKPELRPKPNIEQLKSLMEFRKQKSIINNNCNNDNDIKQEIVIENEKENDNVIKSKTETEHKITIIREKPEIKKKPDISKLNVKPKFLKSMSTNSSTTSSSTMRSVNGINNLNKSRNILITSSSSSSSSSSSTVERNGISETYSSHTVTSYSSNGHDSHHHQQRQEINGFAEKLNKSIDETPILISDKFRIFSNEFAPHHNINLDRQRDVNEKSEKKLNNNDVFFRRTKYRLNEMSRDVPNARRLFMDDTFSNMSYTANEDGTKDCFYSILDKVNKTKGASVRRNHSLQEWSLSDHLESRASLNTINTYFQVHASTGTAVRQLQAQIEAKHNN